jgi:hypothetical protein
MPALGFGHHEKGGRERGRKWNSEEKGKGSILLFKTPEEEKQSTLSADARPGKQRRNRFCRQLDSGRGIDPCFQPCRFGGDLGVFWSRRRLLLVRTWLPVR